MEADLVKLGYDDNEIFKYLGYGIFWWWKCIWIRIKTEFLLLCRVFVNSETYDEEMIDNELEFFEQNQKTTNGLPERINMIQTMTVYFRR